MKLLKFLSVCLALILTATNLFACAVYGLPNRVSYETAIFGITAGEDYSGSLFIGLDVLINNILFDDGLTEKQYYELEIKQKKPCSIKGITFMAKSSQDAELTFQAKAYLKNRCDVSDIFITCEDDFEVILTAQKIQFIAGKEAGVVLCFNETLALRGNDLDKLKIEILENKGTGESCEEAEIFKAPFKFDGLLVFFDPGGG